MRKRMNYGDVTATLALFFALSGGALAAKHYLITSTKQISPKVLKALKGNKGATGATGTTGGTGKEGTQGKEGSPGREGKAGETGKEGTPGKDGAVAGYSASQSEPVPFKSGSKESPTTLVTRTLPAGNFIVIGKVEVLLTDGKAGASASIVCRLTDTPSGGGAAVSDSAPWSAALNVPAISTNFAQNTLPLTLAVNSESHLSTLVLGCYVGTVAPSATEFEATASKGSITAVQTSQNS